MCSTDCGTTPKRVVPSKHPEARYFASTRVLAQCPSCAGDIGHLEEPYKRLLEQGKSAKEALDALRITRLCCRLRVTWPVVLPVGGFVLPGGEAAMNNYLGFKQRPDKPSLAVLSLRKSVKGENFIFSHVTHEGFIGEISRPTSHQATDVLIYGEPGADVGLSTFGDFEVPPEKLDYIAEPSIYTEPGQISRMFPYEVRQVQPDYPSTSVRSFFDLPLKAQVDAMRQAKGFPAAHVPSEESETDERLRDFEEDGIDFAFESRGVVEDEQLMPTCREGCS